MRNAMLQHRVSRSNVVVDSDGLGSFLESYLNGIRVSRWGKSTIE